MFNINTLFQCALIIMGICRSSCRVLAVSGTEIGAVTGVPGWANNISSASKTYQDKERIPPEDTLAVALLLTAARGPGGKDLLQDARTAIRTMDKYIFPYTPSKL